MEVQLEASKQDDMHPCIAAFPECVLGGPPIESLESPALLTLCSLQASNEFTRNVVHSRFEWGYAPKNDTNSLGWWQFKQSPWGGVPEDRFQSWIIQLIPILKSS